MYTDMINERGLESALSACPRSAAASHLVVSPRTTAPVQAGLGADVRLRTSAAPITSAGMPTADLRVNGTSVRQFVQLFPIDPGDVTRRPPA